MRRGQPASFVVRLQDGAEGPDLWMGEVEHVQTGHRARLSCLDDLVRFVEAEIRRHAAAPRDEEA